MKGAQAISVANVVSLVAINMGIEPAEILSSDRSKSLLEARHIAIFLARQTTGFSFVKLAECFGRRDPRSLSHIVRAVRARGERDREYGIFLGKLWLALDLKAKLG